MQANRERRAFARFAFAQQLAAHGLHQLADDAQAQPGGRFAARRTRGEPAITTEHALLVLSGETRALIPDHALHEVTGGPDIKNADRVAAYNGGVNVGQLDFDTTAKPPKVTLHVLDGSGKSVFARKAPMPFPSRTETELSV